MSPPDDWDLVAPLLLTATVPVVAAVAAEPVFLLGLLPALLLLLLLSVGVGADLSFFDCDPVVVTAVGMPVPDLQPRFGRLVFTSAVAGCPTGEGVTTTVVDTRF